MSDTPRTDVLLIAYDMAPTHLCLISHARELERELNAANDRIKRLEHAGEKMVNEPLRKHRRWILNEAKEAKP